MSDSAEYTAGWIHSISTKFAAARAILNEDHEGPKYIEIHDSNSYAIRPLGKHNVATATLADNGYYTRLAAIVARDMMCSFPT